MDKPFSPACERNREPILAVLREFFADRRHVLEVGSGTGQHAVHFAAAMPWLSWQASDRAQNLPGIEAWRLEAMLPNTPPPIELDVTGLWPQQGFDAVFSANTLHIMAWDEVEAFFAALPLATVPGARLAIYGPFHRDGKPTSPSNAAFDADLRQRAAHMGVRDDRAVKALAAAAGFDFIADHDLPANNRLLLWQRP